MKKRKETKSVDKLLNTALVVKTVGISGGPVLIHTARGELVRSGPRADTALILIWNAIQETSRPAHPSCWSVGLQQRATYAGFQCP